MKQQPVYLDYAAATPVANEVILTMQPYWQDLFYNPSAASLPAKRVKQDLETARTAVAQVLGAKSGEVFFTAGGTEANNLANFGVAFGHEGGHIVVSAIEHDSVLEPAKQLAKLGHQITKVKPDKDGLLSVSEIKNAITDKTVLVSIMYANNEVGTVQPIKQIAVMINDVRNERKNVGNQTPIYFHTDAAQAANYLDLHVHRLGIDLMTLNGGKIYGPKQTGVLFIKAGVVLRPLVWGGGQEGSMRSGTENIAGSLGFAKALELASKKRHSESKRLSEIQKYCIESLKANIPTVRINGSVTHRLPNNVHFTVPGTDNERVLYSLEESGYICAAGSACSASKEEASHVLIAMGMTEADARSSIRISMGRGTTKENIDNFIAVLKRCLR